MQKPYTIHFSKKKAILALICALNNDSIGIIVGKGVETTEEIQNVKHNHSDYLEVKKRLSAQTLNQS